MPETQPYSDEEEEENVYVVEKILAHKLRKNKIFFLIKWEGFDDPKDNTWEQLENLNCPQILNDYVREHQIINLLKSKFPKKSRIIDILLQQCAQNASSSEVEISSSTSDSSDKEFKKFPAGVNKFNGNDNQNKIENVNQQLNLIVENKDNHQNTANDENKEDSKNEIIMNNKEDHPNEVSDVNQNNQNKIFEGNKENDDNQADHQTGAIEENKIIHEDQINNDVQIIEENKIIHESQVNNDAQMISENIEVGQNEITDKAKTDYENIKNDESQDGSTKTKTYSFHQNEYENTINVSPSKVTPMTSTKEKPPNIINDSIEQAVILESSDSNEPLNDDKHEEETEAEVYEVERIVKHRKLHRKLQFFIKWVGFSNDENTWEDFDNLNCSDLLNDYRKQVLQRDNIDVLDLVSKKQMDHRNKLFNIPPDYIPKQPNDKKINKKGKEENAPSISVLSSNFQARNSNFAITDFDIFDNKILYSYRNKQEPFDPLKNETSRSGVSSEFLKEECPQDLIDFLIDYLLHQK